MADPTVNAGDLRQRIQIWSPPSGLDNLGQDVASLPTMDGWTSIASRWAKIEVNNGKPYIAAEQVRNLADIKITLRYFAGLTPQHRLTFGSRIFNILIPINTEERNIEHVVICQEVL